jgi:hypothetical protein
LPDAERVSSFYDLWCEREALLKLVCNLDRKADLPGILTGQDTLEFERFGWQRYRLAFAGVSVVAFSERPLFEIRERILNRLTRAAWQAGIQHVSSKGAVCDPPAANSAGPNCYLSPLPMRHKYSTW